MIFEKIDSKNLYKTYKTYKIIVSLYSSLKK